MNTPVDRYLTDVICALKGGAYYSALALSLTLPDICGAIEFPDEVAANKRYRDWFNIWCGLLKSSMTAADCWAMRCSYLHLASDEFIGDAAKFADLSHIQFTVGKIQGGWSYSAVPGNEGFGTKPAVRIPVETFCTSMVTSADAWRRSRAGDARILVALDRLFELRRVGEDPPI